MSEKYLELRAALGEAWIMLSHLRDTWDDSPYEHKARVLRIVADAIEEARALLGAPPSSGSLN